MMKPVRRFPGMASWKMGFFIALCLLAVVSLLYCAENVPGTYPVFRRILQSLAAIILTSGIISILANLLVHRELADFWLDALEIRESFKSAGLKLIAMDFNAFDFRSLLAKARRVDICVIYATTWLGAHLINIREFLSRPDGEMRVCLLDETSTCIDSLAESFGYTVEEVKKRIGNAEEQLRSSSKDLQAKGKTTAWLRIYKHNRPPRYTYYRFDDILVLVPYNLSKGKTKIPIFAFERRPGGVSDFLEDDFQTLLDKHSKVAYDSRQNSTTTYATAQ